MTIPLPPPPKKKEKSPYTLLAILAGVLDVLLVGILLVGLLIKPVHVKKLTPQQNENFVENAEDYYTSYDDDLEYTSDASLNISHNGSSSTVATPQTTSDDPYEGFVFPNSNTTELSDSDISATVTTDALCRRAINEIYARHGYAFSKQENTDFFNQYDWYKNMAKESDMATIARMFNAAEKANVEKLQAFENAKNWN